MSHTTVVYGMLGSEPNPHALVYTVCFRGIQYHLRGAPPDVVFKPSIVTRLELEINEAMMMFDILF